MKRWLALILCSVALMLAQNGKQDGKQPPKLAAPAGAQQGNGDNVFTFDVTRVNLLFTVADKKGRFISDLTRDDFEIFENKKKQNILEFTAESDLPLRLAILIDTSNSIRDRFKFIQEAATDFVTAVMRTGQDKAMVMRFDSTAEIATGLTGDTVQLVKTVKELKPGGGTALYDAIFISCRDELPRDQPRDKYRRAIVLLSDGLDDQSHWTLEQALEMAHKADTVIYTISTNMFHDHTPGDDILKHLSEETGGVAFYPTRASDMAQAFENIANELRHQYNIFYRPDPLHNDGLYHSVNIRVKNHNEMLVRARKGYYAQSP